MYQLARWPDDSTKSPCTIPCFLISSSSSSRSATEAELRPLGRMRPLSKSKAVDPEFVRHLRVSIRGSSATWGCRSGVVRLGGGWGGWFAWAGCHGGRSGVRPPSEGVDPGFVRLGRDGVGGLLGLVARVVDPGFVRHLRVSVRGSSALLGLVAMVVDPGFVRYLGGSVRGSSALAGMGWVVCLGWLPGWSIRGSSAI